MGREQENIPGLGGGIRAEERDCSMLQSCVCKCKESAGISPVEPQVDMISERHWIKC